MASSSLTADGSMRTLWLATTLQVFEHVGKGDARLAGAGIKGRQILGILGQAEPHGRIDQLGDALFGLGGFDAEGPVNAGIEVDGGALGCGHARSVAV